MNTYWTLCGNCGVYRWHLEQQDGWFYCPECHHRNYKSDGAGKPLPRIHKAYKPRCAVCGRRVRSTAYVGYEDQALCYRHRENYAEQG
jgi:DNA-directed RNA polymerase subunit RPC12/RpoP